MSTEKRIDKYYKKKNAERRSAAEARDLEPEVKTLTLQTVDWHRGVKIAAVVAVVVFAAYLWTLWGGYVYCDTFNITPFRTVTREWGPSLLYLVSDAFTTPLSQPLVRATYATDIAFGTYSSSAVFHGDSLCIHLANCVLIFILVFKLAGLHNQQRKRLDVDPYAVGAGAAILFACHPLASEAVSYVSARSALLVTLNYLLALLFFLRGFHAKVIKDSLIGYGCCYLFMLFAIWSGPQGLTAAASMIVLALLVKPGEETVQKWVGSRPLELFSIALVALVVPFVLLMKYQAPIGNGFGLEALPAAQYIATQCKLLVTYYLRVLFVPVGLSLDPPYGSASGFSDPIAIVGALIPFGLLALAWKYRSSILVAFPLVVFVLGLLPDFLLPQPEVMSDRRMYLPLAAACIPFGYLVAKASEKNLVATIVAGAVLTLGFIGLTNWRNYAWQEDSRLWADAYQMNKTSERSRIMRVWGLSRGQINKARDLALEEVKVFPNSALLHLVLGKANNAGKKYKEAREYFEKALSLADKQNLSPEVLWDLQYGMAYACLQSNDIETANKYADLALLAQPNNATLHIIKGEYFLTKDQPQAALDQLNKAHTLDRYNPEVLAPLARAALGCGTKEYQDLGYQAALLAGKIHNDSRLELLKAYGALETGRVHEAMLYMDKYKLENKVTPEFYYILYGILKRLGADKEASQAYKVATTADPEITKKIRLYLNRPIILPPGAPKTKLPNMNGLGSSPDTADRIKHSAPPLVNQQKRPADIPPDAVGLPLKAPKGEFMPTDVQSTKDAGKDAGKAPK
jgi:tetratricopeptide (TPR) repeat protein